MIESNSRSVAPPTVSVVVPCRNEVSHIESCLRSILQQQEPEGGFEVIVADGMSDDGTRGILERMAAQDTRLKVVDNLRRITPCGMNCAIRQSTGQWIAIMGSHNRYAPDYLVQCLEAARTTGADNVGGAMFSEGNTNLQRAIAAAHHSRFSVGGARWHNPDFEGLADTVFGGFYKREVLERIGLFDEELVRNQDDELNLRLTRAGGKIWQSPRIQSWYHPRKSLSALFGQYAQYGYWKVRVIQKHRIPASWRHLVPGAFVLTLTALCLCSIVGLTGWLLGGWSGLAGLVSLLALAVCLVCYFTAAIAASIATSRTTGWSLLPQLPFVFFCYHWGYGYGFLRGVWDFVVRRKRPGAQFVELTRVEPAQQPRAPMADRSLNR
jgi:succinoglycan biosynthesis protein ExoA